jgi:transposase
VLRRRFGWAKLSMSGALAYRPDRSEAALLFQIREGAYNTDSLIDFLNELHAHFGADKVTMIWDGLPSQRSKAMTAWIATQRHWLLVERLHGYAHDLNPIEMVWGSVKAVELANRCPQTIDEAHAAQSGLQRVGSSYDLCFAFLAHTGLPYDLRSPNYPNVFKTSYSNQAVSTRPRLMAPPVGGIADGSWPPRTRRLALGRAARVDDL